MAEVEKVDVLIIGSGPAGTSTALHLIKSNPNWAKRIVIVDKAVHPREKLCGGGITHLGQNILADLGLPFEPASFEVKEVKLVYQDKSYSFLGDPVFRIIRRDEFDHWLVQQCESFDIPVRQGEGVKKIIRHDDYMEVVTEKATFHAKAVVGADGSRSFVRHHLKWEDEARVARLIEVLTPEDEQTQPEFQSQTAVFDFTHMTDGLQGYYWDFPSYVNKKAFMNRGLFDSRARPERKMVNLKQTLDDSLSSRDRNLADYKIKGLPIRWWGKNGRFSQPRVILVGDAAGTDPLFGEGISFALGYGKPAAVALNDAFERSDFSFDTYADIVKNDPLFKQLDLRTRLAKFAYLMKYPWFVRGGWQVARWVIKFTRWRNPSFVPAYPPDLHLSEVVRQST